MIRKNLVHGGASILFAIFLAYCSIALAQTAADGQRKADPGTKGGTPGKETRWEGRVERRDKDNSSLTVRKSGSSVDRTVVYDSSTKWVSQYHADKKVNDIDASHIKDGDYVIVKGIIDKAGVIHASVISKRLSHSD